jgi:hypothetical protein
MRRDNPFTITVGTSGEVLVPLCCAKRNTAPMLTIGPDYETHNFRVFAKMPSRSDAERLAAPFGYDRGTVTFDVQWLMLYGELPAGLTAKFYSVSAKGVSGKIQKHDMHAWTHNDKTGNYPSVKIEIPLLSPGGWISIEGVSRFYTPRIRDRKKNLLPVFAPVPAEMPKVEQHILVPLQLIARLHHLPTMKNEPRVQVVRGSPFDHARPAHSPPSGPEIMGGEPPPSPLNSSGSDTPTSGASPSPDAIHSRRSPES